MTTNTPPEPTEGLVELLKKMANRQVYNGRGTFRPAIDAVLFREIIAVLSAHAEREAKLTAEIERLRAVEDSFMYLCKWVERGMFDPQITPIDAIRTIAHSPAMPWKNRRWDVDHKPYAKDFYGKFPTALESTRS